MVNQQTQREELKSSRRSFLESLWSGGVVLWLLSILYPIWEYLKLPKITKAMQSNVTVGKVGEIAPNSGKVFPFDNKPAIVVRTPGGEFRAFTAVCTHLQCTVQYRSDMEHIWCACHNGHYDLEGRNIAGPPPRPLEPYKVIIKDDNVIVSKIT